MFLFCWKKEIWRDWKIEWGDYCGDLFLILKQNFENQPVVSDREDKQKASFCVCVCLFVCLCVICLSCGEVTQVRHHFLKYFALVW